MGQLAKSENGSLSPEDEKRKTVALDTLLPYWVLEKGERRPEAEGVEVSDSDFPF